MSSENKNVEDTKIQGVYVFKVGKDGFLYPVKKIGLPGVLKATKKQIQAIKDYEKRDFLEDNKKIKEKEFSKNYKVLFELK